MVQSFLRDGRPKSALLVAFLHSPMGVMAMSGSGAITAAFLIWLKSVGAG